MLQESKSNSKQSLVSRRKKHRKTISKDTKENLDAKKDMCSI